VRQTGGACKEESGSVTEPRRTKGPACVPVPRLNRDKRQYATRTPLKRPVGGDGGGKLLWAGSRPCKNRNKRRAAGAAPVGGSSSGGCRREGATLAPNCKSFGSTEWE